MLRCALFLSALAFGASTIAQTNSTDAVPLLGAGPQATPPGTDPKAHEALSLPVPLNPSLPTLWLVGDSTVRNGHGDGANGQWGWGEPLVSYFDPAKINVANRAIGGRSSRTYITEGHWQTTLDMMKAGDFLLIQFGHNDSGPLDDTARARGTLAGVGNDTQDIENPVMKKHERVHTYGWYMRQYVEQAKAKGVTVFMCTLIPRKIWKDGRVEKSGADSYGGWSREIAKQEHVPVIDLNEIIARQYDTIGDAAVEPLFADPHTHTSLAGAKLNARDVILGLKLLQPDPLANYLSAAAAEVPSTMPAPVPVAATGAAAQ
jgi:lysophospholipase L1-like esterase